MPEIERFKQVVRSPKKNPDFPANIPPTYDSHGLESIPWAHQQFPEGEYRKRLDRIRKLSTELGKIEGILLPEFSLAKYLAVASALFTPFAGTTNDFGDLGELVTASSSIGSTIPLQLVEQGILTKNSRTLNTPQIAAEKMSDVLFNVGKYSMLPDDIKDYLGINLLLIPLSFNPLRATIKLEPKDIRKFDERYVQFYEELVKRNLPGFFEYGGDKSFVDRWLGIFDYRALTDKAISMFPQNNINIYGKKSLTNKIIELLPAFGHVYNRPDPIGELIKTHLKDSINTGGKVDRDATEAYQKILDNLYSPGYINFELMHFRMSRLEGKITEEQRNVIGLGTVNYIVHQIKAANFGNLDGLADIYSDVENFGVMFAPEVASKMRFFLENLDSDFFNYLSGCFSNDGMLKSDVYFKELQEVIDRNEINSIKKSRHHTHYHNLEILLPHQQEWKAHLKKVAQQNLPMIEVTDTILDELVEYHPLLTIMSGAQYWQFQDKQIDDKAAGCVLKLLEFNMGVKLENLRRNIERVRGRTFIDRVSGPEIAATSQTRMIDGEAGNPVPHEAYIILFPDLGKKYQKEEFYRFMEFRLEKELKKHIEAGGKVYILPCHNLDDMSPLFKKYASKATVIEPPQMQVLTADADDVYRLQFIRLKMEMYKDRIISGSICGMHYKELAWDLEHCVSSDKGTDIGAYERVIRALNATMRIDYGNGKATTLTGKELAIHLQEYSPNVKVSTHIYSSH